MANRKDRKDKKRVQLQSVSPNQEESQRTDGRTDKEKKVKCNGERKNKISLQRTKVLDVFFGFFCASIHDTTVKNRNYTINCESLLKIY